MPRGWKVVLGVTLGLFGAGVAVGYVAHKRGIPQNQIGRWLLKEATRKALYALDTARDLLPDTEPVTLEEAIGETPGSEVP